MNYSTIKDLARANGLRVGDLIALAPQNDPFYVGRPAEMEGAEWFANLWRRFGYSRGVHLRRIHYQIVSQNPQVRKPNGEPYENTERDWDYLTSVSKWARYLDFVPAGAFVDRRNPAAIINAQWQAGDPTPRWSIDDDVWWYVAFPELAALAELERMPDVPEFTVSGYTSVQQDYHIEVWVEKTTMNDVLEPLCQGFRANLVTGAGELSITAVLDLLRRVQDADRPARILYVSDFDPAGLGMPISVARKIEFYQRRGGLDHLDIRLQPVVLTAEQVDEYDLPRVPVKDSDLRKANFEAAHGEGQVELDALEALYPGRLAEIVSEAIEQYYDDSLSDRAREARDGFLELLAGERDGILEDFADTLDRLQEAYQDVLDEYDETRQRFAEMAAGFQAELTKHKAKFDDVLRHGKQVYEDIVERMQDTAAGIDVGELFPVPEPELPEENDDQLYISGRGYVDQLLTYKGYRNGNGNGTK